MLLISLSLDADVYFLDIVCFGLAGASHLKEVEGEVCVNDETECKKRERIRKGEFFIFFPQRSSHNSIENQMILTLGLLSVSHSFAAV